MSQVAAMILAGGQVSNFGILTECRPKSALPIAGFYRLIDFALSSLSHSELTRVGLIVQYQPASLIEHVSGGDSWDLHGVGRLLKILPPFVGGGSSCQNWFSGTADALYQNINFLEDPEVDTVLIMSGEQIYSIDYRPILKAHRKRGSDVTLVVKEMEEEELSTRFGYVRLGANDEIVEYFEKPERPPTNIVSTGIYVFKKSVLIEWLEANARNQEGHNLAIDVLPFMVGNAKVMGYRYKKTWLYLHDPESYYALHKRLLKPSASVNLVDWEVMTNMNDRGLTSRGSTFVGPQAEVRQSMLSPGVSVRGAVLGSVLSPGVRVEEGAVVEDCILLHDTVVRKGARLRRVIADKDAEFGADSHVGVDASGEIPSGPEGERIPLTIVGKGGRVDDNARVPAGKVIAKIFCLESRPEGERKEAQK